MNWVDFCWPVATGACLTMGLFHLWIGLRGASKRDNLLFSMNAFLVAAYSFTELRLIHAGNPAEYLARLRWLDLTAGALTISLVLFAWGYFGTGRKWLGILGIALISLSVTADLLPVVLRKYSCGLRQQAVFMM